MMEIMKPGAVSWLATQPSEGLKRYILEPATMVGIETIRIELSALPDTRRDVDGLNLTRVGGNS